MCGADTHWKELWLNCFAALVQPAVIGHVKSDFDTKNHWKSSSHFIFAKFKKKQKKNIQTVIEMTNPAKLL